MRVVKTSLPETYTRCPECKTELAYTDLDIEFDIKLNSDKNEFEQRRSIRCCVCRELIILGYDYIAMQNFKGERVNDKTH